MDMLNIQHLYIHLNHSIPLFKMNGAMSKSNSNDQEIDDTIIQSARILVEMKYDSSNTPKLPVGNKLLKTSKHSEPPSSIGMTYATNKIKTNDFLLINYRIRCIFPSCASISSYGYRPSDIPPTFPSYKNPFRCFCSKHRPEDGVRYSGKRKTC